jgi:hypothetical protein
VALMQEDLIAGNVEVAVPATSVDLSKVMRGSAYGPQAVRMSDPGPGGARGELMPLANPAVGEIDCTQTLGVVGYGNAPTDPLWGAIGDPGARVGQGDRGGGGDPGERRRRLIDEWHVIRRSFVQNRVVGEGVVDLNPLKNATHRSRQMAVRVLTGVPMRKETISPTRCPPTCCGRIMTRRWTGMSCPAFTPRWCAGFGAGGLCQATCSRMLAAPRRELRARKSTSSRSTVRASMFPDQPPWRSMSVADASSG